MCLICNQNVHYCVSCGFYPDGEYEVCYDCWKDSGAEELYNQSEGFDFDSYNKNTAIILLIESKIKKK